MTNANSTVKPKFSLIMTLAPKFAVFAPNLKKESQKTSGSTYHMV